MVPDQPIHHVDKSSELLYNKQKNLRAFFETQLKVRSATPKSLFQDQICRVITKKCYIAKICYRYCLNFAILRDFDDVNMTS